MELHFQNPGFDYMLEQILAFQDEDASPFWSAPLYRFYPQLEPARTLPRPARLEAIARELRSVYDAQEQTIHEKTRAYAAHWQRCKPQVTAALSDAFSLDAAGLFNDLQVCLSLNPIEPRYLREHRFDLFYLNSPQGAVGAALHEIIHFFYFYVWNGLFDDPPDACEAPALPWLLSMAAGAMLCATLEELVPAACGRGRAGMAALAVGFAVMMALDVALG